MMKILILGASGRTGKLILKESLQQGLEVNCLVRNPDSVLSKHASLSIFKGSPDNIHDLQKAIKGCDAVISALNISRRSDFPWSRLRTPHTFLSDVAKNIIELNKHLPIKKIIVCSAWGVSETKKDIPFWFRWLIDFSNIGVAYKDHERQEELLKKSNLSYIIVRPVGLTNFKQVNPVLESYTNHPKPRLIISRTNLAKFMVRALHRKDLLGRMPVISEN